MLVSSNVEVGEVSLNVAIVKFYLYQDN
jgi:hypothetical protein